MGWLKGQRGEKMEQSRIDKIKRIHPGADRGLIMDTIKELVTEVERLQADALMLDWIEKQIGGRVSLWPLVVNDIMNGKRIRKAIERARLDPSPASHSHANEVQE